VDLSKHNDDARIEDGMTKCATTPNGVAGTTRIFMITVIGSLRPHVAFRHWAHLCMVTLYGFIHNCCFFQQLRLRVDGVSSTALIMRVEDFLTLLDIWYVLFLANCVYEHVSYHSYLSSRGGIVSLRVYSHQEREASPANIHLLKTKKRIHSYRKTQQKHHISEG